MPASAKWLDQMPWVLTRSFSTWQSECNKRAADVGAVQNGLWLTALLGLDRAAIRRAVRLSEEIALAP